MPLTDAAARTAKPGPKQRKLWDGLGLYLLVTPSGSKLWRWKYRIRQKEKVLALGPYPEVPLSQARIDCVEARALLRKGIDPSEVRKAAKSREIALVENTLASIATEWIDKHARTWIGKTTARVRANFEQDVLPWLGKEQLRDITAPQLLKVLSRIEARGAIDTAHRTRQRLSQMWRYAIAVGKADRDPAADLRGALAPAPHTSFAAILDPIEVGGLLRAIDGYKGAHVTRSALRLAPYVFVRPGELRKAEWAEFDLDRAIWTIPAQRMKQRRDHLVPLARQSIEILRELMPLTGRGRYVFPGVRSAARPMSDNAVLAALRRMGFDRATMTGHGFRAMASTHLHELGWPTDAIERQLAHVDRSKVRAVYHRGEYLAERIRMMQAWADYLDGLRDGAVVVPIGQPRRAG